MMGFILAAGGLVATASMESHKMDAAQEVFASYGIEMDGRKAHNTLYAVARNPGMVDIPVEVDGETAIYKIDVTGRVLNVYEQMGAEYVKVSPNQ